MDQSDNQLPTNSEKINVFVDDHPDGPDGRVDKYTFQCYPDTTIEILLQQLESELSRRRGDYRPIFKGNDITAHTTKTLKELEIPNNGRVHTVAIKKEQTMPPPAQNNPPPTTNQPISMEPQPQQTIVNKTYKVPTKPPTYPPQKPSQPR